MVCVRQDGWRSVSYLTHYQAIPVTPSGSSTISYPVYRLVLTFILVSELGANEQLSRGSRTGGKHSICPLGLRPAELLETTFSNPGVCKLHFPGHMHPVGHSSNEGFCGG